MVSMETLLPRIALWHRKRGNVVHVSSKSSVNSFIHSLELNQLNTETHLYGFQQTSMGVSILCSTLLLQTCCQSQHALWASLQLIVKAIQQGSSGTLLQTSSSCVKQLETTEDWGLNPVEHPNQLHPLKHIPPLHVISAIQYTDDFYIRSTLYFFQIFFMLGIVFHNLNLCTVYCKCCTSKLFNLNVEWVWHHQNVLCLYL